MYPLLFVLGIFAAVVGVGLSIALHEIGHMVPAKRFGVRVTQYMIGFGPTLWSRRGRETEYGVKAIPLGGYVRMIGMFPPPPEAPAGMARAGSTGRFALLAEGARKADLEEIPPGDEDRVFHRLSARRKIVVMMGGPTMNLLISAVVFTVLLVGIGRPTPSTTVDSVMPCLPASLMSPEAASAALAAGSVDRSCSAADPTSPAAAAGLMPGDTVVGVDGRAVASWVDLTSYTVTRPGQTVTVDVVSPGQQDPHPVTLTLATVYRPVVDESGRPTGEITEAALAGMIPATTYVSQPLSAVPTAMWDLTAISAKALLSLPARVVELATDMLSGEPRNPDSPVSVVGIGRISGEVAAAQDPVLDKVATLLSLLAGLNLFLFLFNLLPILPLDGGHVAGAIWEGVRRKVAAIRGRPDPGPVDVARAMPLAYGVAMVMVAMSTIVILADVVNPISLNG